MYFGILSIAPNMSKSPDSLSYQGFTETKYQGGYPLMKAGVYNLPVYPFAFNYISRSLEKLSAMTGFWYAQ